MHDGGPEHAELDHLGALALAAGEVDVEGPAQEARVEADRLGLVDHPRCVERLALVRAAAERRRVEQRVEAHAGDLDRVLQREEQPGLGPLPGGLAGQLLAVHRDGPLGHLGAGTSHERMGQGALARAVRAHDHVDLAAAHREVDAVQDLAAAGRRVQAPHLEHVLALGTHGSTTDTPSSSTTTSYTATGWVAGSEQRLAGQEVERAAVARALDLALVRPDLALRQRVVLVAALVVDGVELVADADERDAVAGDVEAPGLARRQLVGAAERHGLRHRRPAGPRSAASRRACTSRSSNGGDLGNRAPVDDGVEEAPHDETLGDLGRHATATRCSSAGPRRPGPTVEAWEHLTSFSRMSRFGTESACAPSSSTRLWLVWRASLRTAPRWTRMSPL